MTPDFDSQQWLYSNKRPEKPLYDITRNEFALWTLKLDNRPGMFVKGMN